MGATPWPPPRYRPDPPAAPPARREDTGTIQMSGFERMRIIAGGAVTFGPKNHSVVGSVVDVVISEHEEPRKPKEIAVPGERAIKLRGGR